MVDMQKHVFCDPRVKGAVLRERVHLFFSAERYKKKENKIPFSFMVGSSWDKTEHADGADRNQAVDAQRCWWRVSREVLVVRPNKLL